MVLVIETNDAVAIHALSEVAKALKVPFRIETTDVAVVSEEERTRRVTVISRFRGALKEAYTGYQPKKHDWYQQ